MVVKVELKIPGTDVGMRISLGHLDEQNNSKVIKEIIEKKNSDTDKIENNLQIESECECDECSGKKIEKSNLIETNEDSVDMITKVFTSLMKCTATNINKRVNIEENNSISKMRNLKKVNNSNYKYQSDDDDSIARGILGKGCSSDFSVSPSLYPDDILVSYEPKKKKNSKNNKKEKLIKNNAPPINNLKDVRIIPINRTTNATILPNRKFKEESKYDISCISVPTFCNGTRLIKSCNGFRSGIVDSCNNRSKLIINSSKNKYCNRDENLMISVPSAIYPDNILLTLKSSKKKKKM